MGPSLIRIKKKLENRPKTKYCVCTIRPSTLDGHLVTPVKIPCGATTSVCEDDITLDHYSDYADVKRYFKVFTLRQLSPRVAGV